MMYGGLEGLYRLRKFKAKSGTLVKDTGWFKNTITNRGLWLLWAMNGYSYGLNWGGSACAVGSGSTPPTVNDTDMEDVVAVKSSAGGVNPSRSGYVAAAGEAPAYFYNGDSYTFGTGAAAGNLSEVGVYPGVGGVMGLSGNLFSRALILDEDGNPTTITVLSDEILQVSYEVRMYVDTSKKDFTFTLEGTEIHGKLYRNTTYNPRFTGRIPHQDSVDTMQLFLGGGSSDIYFSRDNVVNDVANSGTCWIDLTGTFGATQGTGIRDSFRIATSNMGVWNIDSFDSPVVKGAGKIWTFNFRYTWGRYTP